MNDFQKLLTVFSILLFSLNIKVGYTQNSDHIYFSQSPPGNTPEIFASGIISTEEFEFNGTFSNDATEYFFTRRPTYEGAENRIYYTHLIDGKWSEPTLAPFAKNVFEFEPVMSPSEDKIYFYSERKQNRNENYDGDLWVTEKTQSGWSEPQYFLSPANKKWCMSICPTNSKTIYFSSNYNGVRGIFKAECINGEYPHVTYLEGEINSIAYSHPYVAPDESYIIMDAQPSGRGKPELFICFKNENGSWSKPINMGPEINATKTEFGASVSPDGKYLFFHRRVDGQGDIYWVDSKIIQLLKQKTSKY